MTIISDKFTINTNGFTDIIDITSHVQTRVQKTGQKDGLVHVYVAGSTAAITTIEYEPGLLKDLPEALEKIAPTDVPYHHDEKWYDGNGYAHVRSAIIGSSVTIPLINSVLELGTWQQIVLMDFDNRARSRNIIVQIIN